MLGEFLGRDSRSGEFGVFATAEGAPTGEVRSVLLMPQLGPDDGRVRPAAVSDAATEGFASTCIG